MVTRRRIRRLQVWTVVAALALPSGAWAAERLAPTPELSLAHSADAPVSGAYLPDDVWDAMIAASPAEFAFTPPLAALAPDAIAAGVRADLDRLATPAAEAEAVVTDAGPSPIDRRVAFVFARFQADDHPAASRSTRATVDFAARRWTPAVSALLLASLER